MYKNKIFGGLRFVLFLGFFISLIFSFRAISSISIGLIGLSGLWFNRSRLHSLFSDKMKNAFLLCCAVMLALQFVSLLYTHHEKEAWDEIRLKSGLLFVPLALFLSEDILVEWQKKLIDFYCFILAIACMYCIVSSLLQFRNNGDSSVFFYHSLVKPLHQHAVYFSILVFISLVTLFERIGKGQYLLGKGFHIALLIFFSGFLVLLSSKLVIAFYLLYLLIYFLRLRRLPGVNRYVIAGSMLLFILIGALTFTSSNPVSRRFYEIAHSDLGIVKQDQFGPGYYFNGLQFRLLEWRFVSSILNENERWWLGISGGDAQSSLDEKYITTRMYVGDTTLKTRGFLGYNTHNQFLESLLQNGVPGLAVLLAMDAALLAMAVKRKKRELSFTLALLLVWLLTESVFETQYSLLIFLFFPLLFYAGTASKTNTTDI